MNNPRTTQTRDNSDEHFFGAQLTIGAIMGFLIPLNLLNPPFVALPLLLVVVGGFYLVFRKTGARGFFVGIVFGAVMLFLARWVGGHLGSA